nr:methyltransferase-like protein 4 isoform X2 [Halyomorpha halys]
MSILCSNEKGWVISHYDYSKNLYRNVHSPTGNIDLAYNKSLFKITTPFMRDQEAEKLAAFLSSDSSLKKVRKRRCQTANDTEVQLVQKVHESLLKEARNISNFQLSVTHFDILENNATARNFVNEFYESQREGKNLKEYGLFKGTNVISIPQVVEINNRLYVMPPYSSFICCNLNDLNENDKKFDFILLDPPWWNKHVRRKKMNNCCKGYEMMRDDDIANIPISSYLQDTGLVGIWCTNGSSHIKAIKQSYFPQWGLEYVATWFWIKVTDSGEPVCSFTNSNGKRPYERIIFGASQKRRFQNPEEFKCFLSVPSALHSHKPPLVDILKDYLPENVKCLELFARYLLPGWTSVGSSTRQLCNNH